MKEFNNPNIVCFDVDDTIVLHGDESNPNTIKFEANGISQNLVPSEKVIERIKLHKMQGHFVIVWSHAGENWAKKVINTLKLDEYVDCVMAKPKWIYDDEPTFVWSIVYNLNKSVDKA